MGTLLRRHGLWIAGVGIALVVELAWGIVTRGAVAYDGLWALIWGEQLAQLRVPDFEGAFVPTPHPLWNFVAAAVTPLGEDGSALALRLVTLASAALLGVAAFRLGRALWSGAVGVLFAVLLLSRPALAALALQASVDLPFLALVLLAAALEAERPRRGAPVLIALALAGLLRPEAWLFAAAYGAYLAAGSSGRARATAIALACAGPLAWLAVDLLLTGDPLFSFHRTGEVATRIQPDRDLGSALRLGPRFVEDVLGLAVFAGGVVGAVLAFWLRPERMVLAAALVTLSLLPFLAYGLAGLTLYSRFLLPTAAVLALTCAIAVLGWAELEPGSARRVMAAVGVAVGLGLLVSLPATVDDMRSERDSAQVTRRLEQDLLSLVERAGGRARLADCPVVQVPGRVVSPLLMRRLDKPIGAFRERPLGRLRSGLELTIPTPRQFVLNPDNRTGLRGWQRASQSALPTLASSRFWKLNGRC